MTILTFFRWLAAIYETLKDPEKRSIYDKVLVEGKYDFQFRFLLHATKFLIQMLRLYFSLLQIIEKLFRRLTIFH